MMGRWWRRGALGVACAGAVACTDSTSPGNLELTSAQAQAIIDRAGLIAIGRPELNWLADSLDLVIHSGTTLRQITIRIDGADKSYNAVALNRQIIVTGPSPSSFSTFHLIAFDDPGNPVKFVIVNGYAPSGTATPPQSVNGTFSSATASGHLFEVGSIAVVEWIAATGTATFAAGAQGAACDGFTPANGVTCFASSLTVSFDIIATQPPSPLVPMKTASLASVEVPGVLLHFQPSP